MSEFPELEKQTRKLLDSGLPHLDVAERVASNVLEEFPELEKVLKALLDLWLACWTQEEIAEHVGLSEGAMNKKVSSLSENLPKVYKLAAPAHSRPVASVLDAGRDR